MTMNAHQRQIYGSIAAATGIATPSEDVRVEQSPTFLKEPMQIADFAAGVVAALGTSVAELGQARGLPEQDVFVDRRHALLTLNNWQYHYMNGIHIVGGEITVPVNGIYETRDGRWMCFNGAYPHLRDGILKYFDAPHDQEALIERIARHDAAKIEADFETLGLCAAPVCTPDEWLAHPHGQAMAAEPIVLSNRFGDAKERVLPEARHRPLEGVRVLDVTHVIAGPWSTRVLADHGADVISVRNPTFPFLYAAIFEESYGKKQILLDFAMERSKARFTELLKGADVLVWGYGPGSLERLGFTRQVLMALNPNLVVTRVSAYGPEGPWAERKGWEQLAQSCSGMVDVASRGRDQHHLVAALPNDYATGYLAATGTVAALRQRQELGGFWEVEAMLTRTAMAILSLPHEAEEAVAVSLERDGTYLVDQTSDFGAVFTRLAPAAQLSNTPAFSETGPAINGTHHPFLTGWDRAVNTDGKPKHRPSEMITGGLYGFLSGYGHEDVKLRKE